MFTGIIEATAPVLLKTDRTLEIARPHQFDDLLIGSSIAVAGVCLSVTAFDDVSMTFDVVEETWKRSKLGSLKQGDDVNLERSVLADHRLDGHVVQGHVEGVGCIKERFIQACLPDRQGTLVIEMPKKLNKYCVQKGAIAIDGVSLTIAESQGDTITVALVPHTIANTTLASLRPGDEVNIETDIVGRYLYAFIHEAAAV